MRQGITKTVDLRRGMNDNDIQSVHYSRFVVEKKLPIVVARILREILNVSSTAKEVEML